MFCFFVVRLAFRAARLAFRSAEVDAMALDFIGAPGEAPEPPSVPDLAVSTLIPDLTSARVAGIGPGRLSRLPWDRYHRRYPPWARWFARKQNLM